MRQAVDAAAADFPRVNEALVCLVLLKPKSWLVTNAQLDSPGPVERGE